MFYKDKIVLVTGGSGFIGTHFVQELLKEGAKIRVPLHKRTMIVQDKQVETVNADLTNQEDCRRMAKGIDYIFHAAGAVAAAGVTAGNPMSAINTNIILTGQLLEAAWAENVKGIQIFSSSTGYPVADYPVKEEEFWTRPTHSSYFGYGWMRRYLERMGEFVASKTDIKVTIVRPTAVYGRYDNFDLKTSHVIPALIRKAVEKMDPYEVWGTGDEIRDFLHVTDLVRGCLLAMEKAESCDPINIGYGKAVKIKDIVHSILDAAGHSTAKVVFNSSKPTVIPVRMVDTSKAKLVLNFEPAVSFEKGLNDTVCWYIDNNCGQDIYN